MNALLVTGSSGLIGSDSQGWAVHGIDNNQRADPRCAEVYNIVGGRANSCSTLEAFQRIENLSGKRMLYEHVDQNREGDHICYISDLSKMKAHYPNWDISKSLDDIFAEI
jgi:CDP-paratose 2-epimerase